jgi:ActR/RegA family two-component response regulator
MSATRVLVVADEPQIHEFLKPALTAGGYKVKIAKTGRGALKLIATTPFNIVFLDLVSKVINQQSFHDGKPVLYHLEDRPVVPLWEFPHACRIDVVRIGAARFGRGIHVQSVNRQAPNLTSNARIGAAT